jgi:hypothetical protein
VCLIKADCECGIEYKKLCGAQMPGESRCLKELRTEIVLDAVEAHLAALSHKP